MADEEFKIIAYVDFVAKSTKQIQDAVSKSVEDGFATKRTKQVQETIDKTIGGGGGIAGQFSRIAGVVKKATDAINWIFGRARIGFEDFTSIISDVLGGGKGGDILGGIGGGKGGGKIGGGGAGAALAIVFFAIEIIKSIWGVVKKVYDKLREASPHLSATHNILSRAFQLFLMPIGNFVGIWLRPLAMFLLKASILWVKILRPIEKGLIQFFKDPVGSIIRAIEGIDVVYDWLKFLTSNIDGIMKNIGSQIILGITNSINGIVSSITGIGKSIVNAIFELPAKLADALRQLFTGITDRIGELGQSLQKSIGNAGGIGLGSVGW